jgi:hypothetical protein
MVLTSDKLGDTGRKTVPDDSKENPHGRDK